jgi:hypothetical protein
MASAKNNNKKSVKKSNPETKAAIAKKRIQKIIADANKLTENLTRKQRYPYLECLANVERQVRRTVINKLDSLPITSL